MADRRFHRRAPGVSRHAALLVVVGLLAASVAQVATLLIPAAPTTVEAAPAIDVVAWAPSWEHADALASFKANSAQMAELTPFFWSARSSTSIVRNAAISAAELAAYRSAATSAGTPFVATIVDGMAARAMAAVLADPGARSEHVGALVDFVTAGRFSGVDLDYEQFAFSDGRSTWAATYDAWGAFLTELAAALHAGGKTLAVAVPPIYDSGHDQDSGYWVYNYPVLGQVVDRIRVMTYSYSVASAGPIAPYAWVSTSIDAALSVVPASKLVMGIPAYGTDWVTRVEGDCPAGTVVNKRSITTDQAAAWAAAKGAVATWDPVRRERTFAYVDSFTGADAHGYTVRCNVTRTVWYADADAIHQRVRLAASKGIAGVALWALGYDDAVTWQGIAAARAGQDWIAPPLPTPAPRPAPGPPITSPTSALPARFLDTRAGAKTTDGQFAGGGRSDAGETTEVQIAGRGTVAGDARAVTLNVTALGEGNGFVTVYPCEQRPTTSNLNVRSGQIVSNSVLTRLSPRGTVCLFTQSPAHLVVDVFNVLDASTFVPLAVPGRLVDTRPASPTIDGQFAGTGVLEAGVVMEVGVVGRGGISADARNAVLNVTADGAVGPGFLTVWPCDAPRPATSNVNFVATVPVPNAVVTGLSSRGTVCVVSSRRTSLVIDAFGALDPDRYSALGQPSRLLDTRIGGSTADGEFSGSGLQPAGSVIELQVGGRGGVDASARSAVLNVTVDGPLASGFITVYPCESGRPLVSNVNFARDQTVPNLVVTALSASGAVCIFNLVPTHVVVDVFGTLRV